METGSVGSSDTRKSRPSIVYDDDQLSEAISFVFSRFVGKAPKYPVKQLAEETGKSIKTIYAYRSGEITPGGLDLLKCCGLIGPEFANALMAVVGFNGLHRIEPGVMNVLEVASNLSSASASTTQKAIDGRIDHQEAARLVTEYETMINNLSEAVEVLRPVASSGGSLPIIVNNTGGVG